MSDSNATADDLFKQAMMQHQVGAMVQAEKLYLAVLREQRDHTDALHMLGILAFQRGDAKGALRFLDRALAINPDFADALNTSAGVHYKLRNHDKAMNLVDRALVLRPQSVPYLLRKARIYQRLGDHRSAAETFQSIDELSPDDLSVLDGWASSLLTLGAYADAAELFSRALAIAPDNADLRCLRAQALKGQGLYEDAKVILISLLDASPDYVPALVHLGDILQTLGDVDAAIDHFEHAIRVDPNHAEAHFNYGVALLTVGDFVRGWDEYAWRFKMEAYANRRALSSAPTWAGEPLAGKSILLIAEQGLGDTLQFARYAAPLSEMGGKVFGVASDRVSTLIETIEDFEHVYHSGDAIPDMDFQISMMEIPRVLRSDAKHAPMPMGYLTPPMDAYDVPQGPSVGIVWQGNTAHMRDTIRSLPLAHFDQLLNIDGPTFVSLQFGPGTSQIEELGWQDRLIDLSPELKGFDRTADVVSKLDLVITVDTSMAHLAGALGVPVWVLLAASADWRWGLGASETGWYSSARLFRQSTLGDWEGVFADVAVALKEQF